LYDAETALPDCLTPRARPNAETQIQIDLESSEDDIQEIQQEISVLSTCASPFVTQYKASFLRGHKLWIVMEYLGGGSCLDLVSAELPFWYDL
jgi:serine/threonine protein kinase